MATVWMKKEDAVNNRVLFFRFPLPSLVNRLRSTKSGKCGFERKLVLWYNLNGLVT